MEILTPLDADKYLRETWSGDESGPVVTLSILLQNSGYFGIPHLLMSYIDYLGGLFSGKGPDAKPSDVRDFFEAYYPAKYKAASAWLIYQYRHGLVHQYAPKVIQVNPEVRIGWYVSLDSEGTASHLEVLPGHRAGLYHFQVYAAEFLRDFKASITLFRRDVTTNADRFSKFQQGYAKYQEAEDLDKISRPYITEDDKNWLQSRVTS